MSIELKQAAQQAVDAFDAFGEDDDFASLFALAQKMKALRAAIQQAEAKTGDPVFFVSPAQARAVNGKNRCHYTPSDNSGRYLPVRATPAGLFTQPVYTHPAPGVQELVMVGLSDGLGAWQPIATAPRTGKTMLMWSRKAGFFSGNWPQGCAAGDWRKIGCDWRGGSDWRAQEATHWMPLPAPPVSA